MDTTAKLLASDLMPNTPEVQHGEPMGVGALSIQLPQNGSSKDFTGERFVPGVSAEIEHEHLHRYLLAAAHVKNRIVLDIASGEGYGSYMLAQVATSVIGVDIDVNSVAAAFGRGRVKDCR
jgi:methylase of polypeptide subunit release factors